MASPLAEAHIEAQRRLRAITAAAVGMSWQNLGSWRDEDVDRFLALAVPTVLVAQRTAVALTDAFLARALGRRPIGVKVRDLIGAGVRNGVSPKEVYQRPFVNVWTALKEDKPLPEAVKSGYERATSTAEMDVQLSMRGAANEVAKADERIVGYERVPDGDACDLCLIASTQRYRSGDLMPIHNRCGCGVEPILGEFDPGQVINRDLLRQLKREGKVQKITAQRQRARERLEGVAVHDHGELGPVLTAPGDHFTTEAQALG